jgi:2-(1,2-epoxy-1,2-dihydrophenyl)acetyl-CoA isomerase
MADPAVNLDVRDGAAVIELNRPDRLNAWNRRLGEELWAAVERVRDDDAVRAVMLTGAGRAFSSGADLGEQRDGEGEGELPDLGKRLRELYHPILIGVREMPKPVLAAVNGPAVGIGCSLALAGDLVIASESSYFLLAFINIGLVPDGGSTAFVPARVGAARAKEMALLGERVPARQAMDWGLVNRVIPDEEFGDAVRKLLEFLAKGPTTAYANAKRLLNRSLYPDLEGQLEAEAETQADQGRTSDFIEGVLAFTEKRPPNFSGR